MAKKKAIVKQVEGITFVGRTDTRHWIVMDGPEQFHGSDSAIRPKELILVSLGGCTGSDVASILEKKRVRLDGFEIHITAEETDEHPKVYSSIHIEYVFYGDNISVKAVERAIELSQTKYCGVSAMLQKAVTLTHSYRIESSKTME
ncbi:MAG: osmotically inducible protein OsmC [Chlorobi bacterium]|nr:osmotically inducible protein OsmC [Chlorobiota bacterium]